MRKLDGKSYKRPLIQINNLGSVVLQENIFGVESSLKDVSGYAAMAELVTREAEEAIKFVRQYLLFIDESGFYQRANTTENLKAILECSIADIYGYLKGKEVINLYTLGTIVSGLRVLYTFTGQVSLNLQLSDPIYELGNMLESATADKLDIFLADWVELYGHGSLGYELEAKKMIRRLKSKKKVPSILPPLPDLQVSRKGYDNNDWNLLKTTLKAHNYKIS